LIPQYALGFFFVRETGLVEQVVVFKYYDQAEEYKRVVESEERLEEEKSLLARNMQFYLDQEEVYINGERVYPRVVDVEVGFQGDYKHPYILFLIIFRGGFKRGVNIYENKYEPEVVEYDYRVYWIFPQGARILGVEMGVPHRLLDKSRILVFDVRAGTRVGGYERIEFEL
jgi:hypothetical protein